MFHKDILDDREGGRNVSVTRKLEIQHRMFRKDILDDKVIR